MDPGNHEAQSQFQKALQLYQDSNYPGAIKEFEKLVSDKSDFKEAFYFLYKANSACGLIPAAFRALLNISPTQDQDYLRLIVNFQKMGFYHLSLKYCELYRLSLTPSNINIINLQEMEDALNIGISERYYYLAGNRILKFGKQFKYEAQYCFLEALRRNPNKWKYWYRLATIASSLTEMAECHQRLYQIEPKLSNNMIFNKMIAVDITSPMSLMMDDEINRLKRLLDSSIIITFENESEDAKSIAIDRPTNWEYILTAELLKSNFENIRKGFDGLDNGLVYWKNIIMNITESTEHFRNRFLKIEDIIRIIALAINELLGQAWLKARENDDPVAIKNVTDIIIAQCGELLHWEIDMRANIPTDNFKSLKNMLCGWGKHIFIQLESLPTRILFPLNNPGASRQHMIDMKVIAIPPNIDEINAELADLNADIKRILNKFKQGI
jgi:tetratricopeptide (TPR) repeat protein